MAPKKRRTSQASKAVISGFFRRLEEPARKLIAEGRRKRLARMHECRNDHQDIKEP